MKQLYTFCLLTLLTAAQLCYAVNTDLIIFSYDRPLQLYALLESLQKYTKGINSISIVYHTSNDRYDAAFRELKQTFPQIQLLKQQSTHDFKELTVKALQSGSSEYIL